MSQRQGFNEAAEAQDRLEQDMLDHMPAYRFEKASGLKGIAGNYKYPGGMNAVEFDDAWTWTFYRHGGGVEAQPAALVALGVQIPDIHPQEEINDYLNRIPRALQDIFRNTWDEMVTLNPELKGVRVDRNDIGKVYDVINGVASGFNVNDINYYLEADNSDESRRAYFQDPRRLRIEDETGARPCWIASPETLDAICLKLEERRARAAAIKRASCDPD